MRSHTIIYIDGENFRKKLEDVFEQNRESKPDLHEYDFKGLLDKVLEGFVVDKTIFYFGRIKLHHKTEKKSLELIEKQRRLKTRLEQQGFPVILFGVVRAQETDGKLVFKEKGTDVKLAVDMISDAYENRLKTAVIGSSDSDLQPAIAILKKKGVECVYLGFEKNLNKGLTYTCDRTITIRNSEILRFAPTKLV